MDCSPTSTGQGKEGCRKLSNNFPVSWLTSSNFQVPIATIQLSEHKKYHGLQIFLILQKVPKGPKMLIQQLR